MSEAESSRPSGIRRGLRILGWSALAILTIGVFWRAAVVSQKMTGGWQLIADHVVAVLPPWKSLGGHDQWASRWSAEQADRILNDPQATAADCAGAVYVLHANGPRRPRASPLQIGRVMWGQKADAPSDGIELMDDRYRLAQRLAAKATELEPENKVYWQLRAILLSDDIEAIQSDKQADRIADILKSAAAVDPDNALYDYLLGFEKYCRAQKWVTKAGPEGVVSVLTFDPELFNASRKHYEDGIAKPKVVDGVGAAAMAAKFIEQTPGSIICKLNCIDPGDFEGMRWGVLGRIDSPFYWGARAEAEINEAVKATHLWFLQKDITSQQNFDAKLVSQYSQADPPAYLGFFGFDKRLYAATQTWSVGNSLEVERREEFIVWSVFAVAASLSVWALLALAAIAALTRLVLRRRSVKPAGSSALPIVCWLLAFAITFVVFALLARSSYQILARQVVFWTLVAISIVTLVVFFWFAARFILRQGKLLPKERSRLYDPVRLAVAIGGTFVMLVPLLCVADPKIRLSISGSWEQIPKMKLIDMHVSTDLAIAFDTPADAILQWVLHFGIEWTIVVWIVLFASACWFLRTWRNKRQAVTTPMAWRDKVATGMSYVVRSAIPVMILLFLLSIAAATQWVVCLQSQYDEQLARLGNPHWVSELIEAKVKALPAPAESSPLGESGGEPQSE